MTFNDLGLSAAILKAIASKGYKTPSPIQAKAIPAILAGGDVMAAAQTGTGKTAGFVLPILQMLTTGKRVPANQARALILTPTRELAAQVGESIMIYGKYLPLASAVVFGGVKINPQMMKLRRGVDILVATPGRLMDLYQQNAVKFDHLEVLVLDEADRMLDMGFIRDIKRIINLLPKRRQNLMFSATFSQGIRKLAKGLVHSPIEISVCPRNTAASTVKQLVYTLDKKDKTAVLIKLIKDGNWFQALVFTKTKHRANKLTKQLESKGIKSAAIHGNKSQGARTKALAEFKTGKIQILVATDIAARGLDIKQLPQVVNFDLPNVAEDYVHRIGRTGRAGLTGAAISLVCAEEVDLLSSIERLIQKVLPRAQIEGFEPDHLVKETSLNRTTHNKPRKPRKPRKKTTIARNNPRGNKVAGRKHRPENKPGTKNGNKAPSTAQNKTAKPSKHTKNTSRHNSDTNPTKTAKTTSSWSRTKRKKPAGNPIDRTRT